MKGEYDFRGGNERADRDLYDRTARQDAPYDPSRRGWGRLLPAAADATSGVIGYQTPINDALRQHMKNKAP